MSFSLEPYTSSVVGGSDGPWSPLGRGSLRVPLPRTPRSSNGGCTRFETGRPGFVHPLLLPSKPSPVFGPLFQSTSEVRVR